MMIIQENNEKLLDSLYEIKRHACKLINLLEDEDSEELNERRSRRKMYKYNERYHDRYDY